MKTPKQHGRSERLLASKSPLVALYPKIGPQPVVATRRFGAEKAAQGLAEWRVWRDQYGELWDAGEDVPDPPGWDRWTSDPDV